MVHSTCPNTLPTAPFLAGLPACPLACLQCGKMDQACAFGSTPVLMTYDGDVLAVEGAPVAAPLHLVLVDLAASKDTVVILEQLQASLSFSTHTQQL